jgi:PAS domain S-box-containing protein
MEGYNAILTSHGKAGPDLPAVAYRLPSPNPHRGGAYITVQLIEQRYKDNIKSTLNAVLTTTTEAISLWKEEELRAVQNLAQEETIRKAAKALLTIEHKPGPLLAANAQKRLRRLMKPYLNYYRGYFLIAPDNISLASSRDINVGTPNLLTKYPDILVQLWDSKTRLTPLQHSDVSLSTEDERLPQPGNETLFVGSQVRDDDGSVIALLTLRIDPYKMLLPLTTKGNLGKTGESYFFDRSGILLSDSRFDEQLIRIGLRKQGKSATAHLRLSNPGIDLTQLEHPPSLSDNLPLTRMADNATRGINGADVNGYRDYRGVPVVGAWYWDKQLHIGLAMEQDVAEAYELFYFVRAMIYISCLIATLTLLSLVWVFVSGKQRLAQLQTRLQAIVETADDGIVVIDESGVMESVNPAMETMFGYNSQELLGNNVNLLIPEPDHSQHNGYLERYWQTGEAKIIGSGREVEGKHKNGSIFPVDIRINRLEINSGLYCAGVIRDISERKEAEKNILKAQQEAIAANRAKSTFLAIMSHEIRTPLNGVVGTIDMLTHTSLLPPQQELVALAQDSATLLQGIIDDVLDFSKIEAGRLELEQVPIALEPLVEKLGENLQQLAKTRGVELLLYVDPNLPQIEGDPVRIQQILYNLVGNAIKFSSDLSDRSGQVIISVLLQRRMNGKADICFQISDNGIGMSSALQKRLFRPFVQGEGEITRRFGGTGLGLVITQRLVEIMGGHIELESTEGSGSTFTIHVTLKVTSVLPPIETSNLEGIKVILLSRNETTQILNSYLQHAGAKVVLCDETNIVEMCKQQCFGADKIVVVIDTRGHRESSVGLRNTLRYQSEHTNLYFLLIERGRRRYARHFEEDSMTLDLNVMRRHRLQNAVATLVGRESPVQPAINLPQPMPDIPLSIDEAIEQGRLILLVDDNETNRKVINRQLRMLGYLSVTAENGADALDLWRNGSYALLLTDCHMPVLDGYQLAETIRNEEPDGTHIPIIAITADAMKDAAQKCLVSGMDGYLSKPMQLQQLREALQKWAPIHSEQENVTSNKLLMLNGSIDPYTLSNLLGTQDCKTLAEYYRDFLNIHTTTVEQIESVFLNNDLSGMISLAHKLKSSARTVGANDLANCCMSLENAVKAKDAQTVSQQLIRLPSLFDDTRKWIENYSSVTHDKPIKLFRFSARS